MFSVDDIMLTQMNQQPNSLLRASETADLNLITLGKQQVTNRFRLFLL